MFGALVASCSALGGGFVGTAIEIIVVLAVVYIVILFVKKL